MGRRVEKLRDDGKDHAADAVFLPVVKGNHHEPSKEDQGTGSSSKHENAKKPRLEELCAEILERRYRRHL